MCSRLPPVRIGAGRRDDDVLGVPVGGLVGEAEVHGGGLGLGGDLVLGQAAALLAGRRTGIVVPDPGEHVRRGMGDHGVALLARRGPDGGAVAVLGHDPAPRLPVGAEAGVQRLEGGGHAVRVTAEHRSAGPVGALRPPLGTHEHHEHLGLPGGHPGGHQATGGETASVGDQLARGRGRLA